MSENAYSPPETSAAIPTPPPISGKPARMIVFGILHLVGGLIGLIGIATNLFQGDPKQATLDAFAQPGQPKPVFSPDALAALDEGLRFNSIFIVIGIILFALIIVSGLGLLMSKKWSLKASNTYAVLSILSKIVSLGVAITLIGPAYNRFFDGVSQVDETLMAIMRPALTWGLYGSLFIVVYPILSLILLNKETVRRYLARK
ncbi:MAG: hypothetical protein ACON5H_08835 [Akkermansiaceae bacterium]